MYYGPTNNLTDGCVGHFSGCIDARSGGICRTSKKIAKEIAHLGKAANEGCTPQDECCYNFETHNLNMFI